MTSNKVKPNKSQKSSMSNSVRGEFNAEQDYNKYMNDARRMSAMNNLHQEQREDSTINNAFADFSSMPLSNLL